MQDNDRSDGKGSSGRGLSDLSSCPLATGGTAGPVIDDLAAQSRGCTGLTAPRRFAGLDGREGCFSIPPAGGWLNGPASQLRKGTDPPKGSPEGKGGPVPFLSATPSPPTDH